MNYYFEITLLPGTEIPLYFLWEKLYQQVHLALVEMQDNTGKVTIGVSFPEYQAKRFQLGSKLRLFADSTQELERLNIEKWLSRLMDYVHVTPVRDVPENCRFALFRRVQPRSSNAKLKRLARRKAEREGIDFEQALAAFGAPKEPLCKVPYIYMTSLSSRKTGSEKRYRLLIDQQTAERSRPGKFSTYGLSPKSTVPIF